MADSREEKLQLEATAAMSRSRVAFEKSLEEKCMECIFKNATLLLGARATRDQFSLIPHVIRRDFFKKLEEQTKAKSISWSYEFFSEEKDLEPVFNLLQLLLHESITEFDFGIFESNFDWVPDTWQLLFERCPNLKRVEDNRVVAHPEELQGLLPGLLRLSSLEHIKIKDYRFSGGAIAELVEAFPNLRSLSIILWYDDVGQELFSQLSKLQQMQVLWIGLEQGFQRLDVDEKERLQDELLFECLRCLPLLQEVKVVRLTDGDVFERHFSELELPRRPLALRTVRLRGSLKDWSPELLPAVTKLILLGPLRDVDKFLSFGNLTALRVESVSGVNLMRILQNCQFRLSELSVINVVENISYDPYELFFLCPNLKILSMCAYWNLQGNPQRFPITADNFKLLNEVILYGVSFPQAILMEIIMAPQVKKLELYKTVLNEERLIHLIGRLQRNEILQNLKEFEVVSFRVAEAAREHFVTLFKTLVAYAPRLEFINCNYDYHTGEDNLELPAFLTKLQIPGLHFFINGE